jgi:hypothetical protein
MAAAFGSLSRHTPVEIWHHLPDGQEASVVHAAGVVQRWLVSHAPDRQRVAAFCAVQGPMPSGYPHLLSEESHTPDAHTDVPTATLLHTPLKVGVCPAIVGIAVPLPSWPP